MNTIRFLCLSKYLKKYYMYCEKYCNPIKKLILLNISKFVYVNVHTGI